MVPPACYPLAVLSLLLCDADKVRTPPRATPAVRPAGDRDRRSSPQNARTTTTPTNLEHSHELNMIINLTPPWCCLSYVVN